MEFNHALYVAAEVEKMIMSEAAVKYGNMAAVVSQAVEPYFHAIWGSVALRGGHLPIFHRAPSWNYSLDISDHSLLSNNLATHNCPRVAKREQGCGA